MYGWIFVAGIIMGFLMANINATWLRHFIWKSRRRIRYLFEHKRYVKAYYTCPLCHAEVGRHGLPTKAEHFHDKHPEYRFESKKAGSFGQITYYCLVCGQTTGGFKGMIEKHRHSDVPLGVRG